MPRRHLHNLWMYVYLWCGRRMGADNGASVAYSSRLLAVRNEPGDVRQERRLDMVRDVSHFET